MRTFGQVAAGERHTGGAGDGRRLFAGWRDPAVRRGGLWARSVAWDPWFLVGGLALGVVVGFYELIKTTYRK